MTEAARAVEHYDMVVMVSLIISPYNFFGTWSRSQAGRVGDRDRWGRSWS